MRRSVSLLFLPVLFIVSATPWAAAADIAWQDTAYFVPDATDDPWPWKEGSDAINEAKANNSMAGGMVYAYIRNTGDAPATLDSLTWGGTPATDILEERKVIWWRLSPATLAPGAVGEVALRLRTMMTDTAELAVKLSNGAALRFGIAPQEPPFRIQSVGYGPNRNTVYLYIERNEENAPCPTGVLLDGTAVAGKVRWLSEGYAGRLAVAAVSLDMPLKEGSWHTWTVVSENARSGAALRVFSQPACFGTYGGQNFPRIAANGLDGFYTFGQLSKEALDSAGSYGIRGAMHIGGGTPPEEARGHQAVYGYCLKDEPDVHDYSAKDTPMHERIGTMAQQLAGEAQTCAQLDPIKPSIINLDLTFTPANYCVYGPIADFTTGDCYPVTVGKPITFQRDCVTQLKRAAAPRPIGFIYQGSWEHFAKKLDRYVGKDELERKGWEAYKDPERVRGFGRPPTAEEIRMQMVYCLGAGARSLWSYIDATEACASLLFLGSDQLPDVWAALGLMSRTLRHVASDINLSHPIAWARTSEEKLWVRTLVCGQDTALIAVVNEDNTCDAKGLALTPKENVTFTFPDLPWFKASRVEQLDFRGPRPVRAEQSGSGLRWTVESLRDVALFKVTGHAVKKEY